MDSEEELEDTSEKKRSSMEARKFPQPAEEEPSESGNHPASVGLALPEMFLKVMLSFRLLKRNLKYSFFSLLSFIKPKEEIKIFFKCSISGSSHRSSDNLHRRRRSLEGATVAFFSTSHVLETHARAPLQHADHKQKLCPARLPLFSQMKVEENQSEWPSCLIYSAAAPFDASHCKRCCLIPFRCELKCFEERHAFSGKEHKKKYVGEPGDIAKRREE